MQALNLGWTKQTLAMLFCVAVLAGCTKTENGGATGEETTSQGGSSESSGDVVESAGSSTVFPVTKAMAEAVHEAEGLIVNVQSVGSSGGFKALIREEIDFSNASRLIKETEKEKLAEKNIEYLRLDVGVDGLTVVINPENDFCDCLTIEQLRELWKPESTIKTWKDLNPEWPAEEIDLYGPDANSGTFDYFCEEVIGTKDAEVKSRRDYTRSSDDNVLVQGVSSSKFALGYFGYAYYKENSGKLKALGISNEGGDCVKPTPETIEDGSYTPLSRPLFLYVNKARLAKPDVAKFLLYYMDNMQDKVVEVGYVPVSDEVKANNIKSLNEAIEAAK